MSNHSTPTPFIDTRQHMQNDLGRFVHIAAFAPHDLAYCLDFLRQYEYNNATFESYRREVERLIQWAWLIEKKSVLNLKRQDIEFYIQFCLNPPPSWIGYKKVARFITSSEQRIPNPEWRPFVVCVSKSDYKKGIKANKQDYQLSQKAITEIFSVLSSFFNHLVLDEKISVNPIALIRQKSKYIQKHQAQAQVLRLSEQQWRACLDTAKEMARLEPDKHERTLFIISALYLLYLRISELAASERWRPEMCHFFQDSKACWWFKTVGKGNKLRNIAVPDDMLSALKQYRQSLHMPPLPSVNDHHPLLPKEVGKGPMSSTRHIRRLVQLCFDATIDKLSASGFAAEADRLASATVHWLRHTGISDDINLRGRPVAHVRDDAGHSSSAITDRYNDIDLIERHKTAKDKQRTEG